MDQPAVLTAQIIIIALCALLIAFAGLRVLHVFERFAFIPILITMIILAGCAGAHGKLAGRGDEPVPTAANVLSFVSLIVGWSLSWSPLASDFFAYHSPAIPSWKIFLSTFFGLYLSCAPTQFLGAALIAAAPQNQAWEDGFTANGVGGLIGGAFADAGLGNFGKFLLVLFGLGMITNNAPTIYAWSLNAQVLLPWLVAVPRFVFCVIATAIYLPLAVVGASAFYATLNSFAGILSYWSAILVGILAVEHLIIRHGDFASYDPADYMSLRRLPPGIAAFVTSIATGAALTTGMDQVWYRGPIAQAISGPDATAGGDVGFELALVIAPVLYLPLRLLERRVFRR